MQRTSMIIAAGSQPGRGSAVHLKGNLMKKGAKDRKVALEVLDWIRSLDLPKESSGTSYEYFRDNNIEEVDQTQLLEYKAKLLSTGWKLFMHKHKRNLKKKLALLRKDVTSAVQMSTVRLRLYVQRWRRFVTRSYLSTSAKGYIAQKYEGRMKYRYLLRAVIGYWALKVRSRARSKRRILAMWRRRCNGHSLVHKFFKLHDKLLTRAGFLRWRRRSKWPLVNTKRDRWQLKGAMHMIQGYAADRHAQHGAEHVGVRSFLCKHWPTLRQRAKAHKQRKQRLQMGAEVFSMRCVAQALHWWRRQARLCSRFRRKLAQACKERRAKRLSAAVKVLRYVAVLGVKAYNSETAAARQWKRACWGWFRRGIKLVQRASALLRELRQCTSPVVSRALVKKDSADLINSSSKSKARFVVFRGRVFRRRHALLRLMRHNVRSIVQQRAARLWGMKWWKRVAFRNLQLLCRQRRNVSLINCYASMQCKLRLLRLSIAIWRHRAALEQSLSNLAQYCYTRKYLRRWVRRARITSAYRRKQRRAGLRSSVNRLQSCLQHWHVIAQRERNCRYSLRVFRKLHPVPAVSAIRCIFDAWRYEYTADRKKHKQLFKAVVCVRKRYSKQRFLRQWGDATECAQVQRVRTSHGFLRLYQQYQRCRTRICEVSNALMAYKVSHPVVPPPFGGRFSLPVFLVSRGLMVHTTQQLRRVHQMCFLRRYFGQLHAYCLRRRRQLMQFKAAHDEAVAQCSARFAAYYHVANKHAKWQQWRTLRTWYQIQQRRTACINALNTRIGAKQYFHRWIELYNRRVIDHSLRVPSAPIVLSPTEARHQGNSARMVDPHRRGSSYHHSLQQSNLSFTRDYSTISTDAAALQPSIALDTSVHVLQFHPAHIRRLEKSRLRDLSLSTIRPSADDSVVLKATPYLQHSRAAKPRYGKMIEPTHSLVKEINTSADQENRTAAESQGGYLAKMNARKASTPKFSKHRGGRSEDRDHSMRSGLEESFATQSSSKSPPLHMADTSIRALTPSALPRKLWGRLIEEDCIDAAKRSYSGQYLLSKNHLPVAM